MTDIWVASGLIGNRGFYNHTPEDLADWAASYEALGMQEAADRIRECAAIMLRVNWDTVDPTELELEEPERRYYAADKESEHVVAAYIRAHAREIFDCMK